MNDMTAVEVSEDEAVQAESRARALQLFADVLKDKRREAVEARNASGIEKQWQEDEEFYDAIDDANRAEVVTKGQTPTSPISTEKQGGTKSTVFVGLTQPYVDMAASRLCDILIPTQERPFSIKPTPEPELSKAVDSPETLPVIGPDGQQQEVPVADVAKKMLAEAVEKAVAAETKIWDWWVEGKWLHEARKVVWEAAKLGTGIIKGPFPTKQRAKKITTLNGAIAIEVIEKIVPASKFVPVWNVFPDAACGEEIKEGSYLWEKDEMTYRQVEGLKGTKLSNGSLMYLDDQLDMVLREGPGQKYEKQKCDPSSKDKFEVWYYYGTASAEEFRAAGFETEGEDSIPVLVMTINDRVCLATHSFLDSGDIPFDVFRWNKVAGKWYGSGVARQVRTPQRGVNAATRALMDNSGVSSGPQIIFKRGVVTPANGRYEITGLKLWSVEAEHEGNVGDAITSIVIPSVQKELMGVIDFWSKKAEEATNMPLLMQGQQGAATETVGGMTMLDANASTVLRNRCKFFDDDVTAPHVSRYYDYLLQHHDDPLPKGDFQIQALGSTTFYQRDAMAQQVIQMQPMLQDPEYRIDKAKWFAEWCKGQKMQPSTFQYSDDEWKQIQEQMAANPPKDPRIAVAEIKAQTDIKKAEIDMDRDTVYEQAAQARAEQLQGYNLEKLALEREIALMRENGEMARKLKDSEDKAEKLKVDLAKLTMELNTQKQLAMRKPDPKPGKPVTPQVRKPKMEPVGQAPDGQAFQK